MVSSLRWSQDKLQHWKTDLVEGQFQFSMKSHQKEGGVQVFHVQVTTETFCSRSHSFSSGYFTRDQIWDGNQHDIRCYSSAVNHKPFTTTSCYCHHHCWGSTFRSVPADEVDNFQFSGCMSGPHFKSKTVIPRLNTWRSETFWPLGMRQWKFSMKYNRRPENARDRSQQVNRSPHFNFQKQHRPLQDVNTYSPYWILNQSPYQLCSLLR